MKAKIKKVLLFALVIFGVGLIGLLYFTADITNFNRIDSGKVIISESADLSDFDIPLFSGTPYVELNNNIPDFTEKDFLNTSFEIYSDLDSLGRCGAAFANIGQDIIPKEERGAIGQVKPSGWHTVKYDCVDGKYLYNRCHLIAYKLAGENSNEKNLITGTRYMNIQGMLPFEGKVYDYVIKTGNHVLYRVTPVYKGNELVASGVQMEGWSVEDNGEGVCFNVFVYNVQPGIEIDYTTGESRLLSEAAISSISAYDIKAGTDIPMESSEDINISEGSQKEETASYGNGDYILNTNTYKFHYSSCSVVDDISDRNKEVYVGDRSDLISEGYVPCKLCKP